MKRVNSLRTICEVLREINDQCIELNEHAEKIEAIQIITGLRFIQKLSKEAHGMAKRMTKKLYEYNKEFDAGWWEENKDYEQDLLKRLS